MSDYMQIHEYFLSLEDLGITRHVVEKSIPLRCPEFDGYSAESIRKILKERVPFARVLLKSDSLYPYYQLRRTELKLKANERVHARADERYVYFVKQIMNWKGELINMLISMYEINFLKDAPKHPLGEHLKAKGQTIELFV